MQLSDVEQRLMFRLSKLTQALEAEFCSGSGELALTPRQLLVLAAVSHSPGAIQTELVVRTKIDRSTIGDLIGRMVKKNLLQRKRSRRDSRAYRVYITDHGADVLEQGAQIALVAEKRFLSRFPIDIRQKLMSL